jgi:hypothetical protein
MNQTKSIMAAFLTATLVLAGCGTSPSEVSATKKTKATYYTFDGPALVDLSETNDCGGSDIPELKACRKVKGEFFMDSECNAYCSEPIAKPGYVAGYDLGGYRQEKALPKGQSCPQGGIVNIPGMCRTNGGRVSYDINCNVLCSKPVLN